MHVSCTCSRHNQLGLVFHASPEWMYVRCKHYARQVRGILVASHHRASCRARYFVSLAFVYRQSGMASATGSAKWCIVTCARRGIGRRIADTFAGEGMSLVLVAHSVDAFKEASEDKCPVL